MFKQTGASTTKALMFLVVIVGVAVLAGLGYLDNRLNILEERLLRLSETEQQSTPAATPGTGNTVYVPAYSHVYSHGGQPLPLEVSLSVRNTDPEAEVTLTRVDYFDTKGELLRRYVTKPVVLSPLETRDFLVKKADYEGGAGANFIVQWRENGAVNKPLIEAVMVGIDPEYNISFVRPGISVHNRDNQEARKIGSPDPDRTRRPNSWR